LLWAGPMAV
nr:Chain C, LEU-LEU-TRP-ALA-GLY-PRO-MET-ALA-VAL [Yellow fever virus]6SS7_F Chain F, LEU-LEU-TRP-ALA-GLY-PRO-MET-ALA-VAL [Yellow fever virus]